MTGRNNMINSSNASDYQKCSMPWVFDRIEIVVYDFSNTAIGSYSKEKPILVTRLSLIGIFHCDYASGPHLWKLAQYCEATFGSIGSFGLNGCRRIR